MREAGLYSGKLGRGAPTRYQQGLIKKFDAVIKGRAVVLEPKAAKQYSKLYTVKGKKVIVPRGAGEKIILNKHGNVTRTRKGPRGEKITSTARRQKPGQLPPQPVAPRRVQYAIPFARKISRGVYRLEWQRFPTWESLAAFMATYEKEGRYSDWANFVFEEEIFDLSDTAERKRRNNELNKAAVQYGKAKSELEFEDTASPIMRAARKTRRKKQSARYRKRGRGE